VKKQKKFNFSSSQKEPNLVDWQSNTPTTTSTMMSDLKMSESSLGHSSDHTQCSRTTRPVPSIVYKICLILALLVLRLRFPDEGIVSLSARLRSAQSRSGDAFHWTHCESVDDRRFKCGYLDVPLDYTNKSDPRTIRLAVNLYQPGKYKSKQTIIINPGGPGGSGTASLYTRGPYVSKNLTMGDVDVLGFDPRGELLLLCAAILHSLIVSGSKGVNMSEPAISCFPNDAFRDRWSSIAGQYYETAIGDPMSHLRLADSMAEATMKACLERWGDLPRFLSTAFVARDVNSIREALGEDEIWGYMVSYGSGIGTHVSQLFPEKIGRLLLDGLEFVKDHRELGGFGWTVSGIAVKELPYSFSHILKI
jgi:pimeloyl-ACP methyl ester carboxylesterase